MTPEQAATVKVKLAKWGDECTTRKVFPAVLITMPGPELTDSRPIEIWIANHFPEDQLKDFLLRIVAKLPC